MSKETESESSLLSALDVGLEPVCYGTTVGEHGTTEYHGAEEDGATHLIGFKCDLCLAMDVQFYCTGFVEYIFENGLVACPCCTNIRYVKDTVYIIGTL